MGGVTLYKVLNPDRSNCHGGHYRWPEEGEWLSISGPLVPRRHGLHVCTLYHLVDWLGPVIWEVEIAGDYVERGSVVVAQEARLTRRVEGWDERIARRFAIDCAERALEHWRRDRPGDDRPERAVDCARRYVEGRASRSDLFDAWDLAMAARRAARWGPTQDAAEAAAWATWPRAATAARYAAMYGALAAAPHPKRERRWQTGRLWSYLMAGGWETHFRR